MTIWLGMFSASSFVSQDLSVVGVIHRGYIERLRRWQKLSGIHIVYKKAPL
jgi:hypothetical protein